MKKLFLVYLLLIPCLFGAKKEASLIDYGNANNPDKDRDFEVSRTELKTWCGAFIRVHYTAPLLTKKFPVAVEMFELADDDADGELTTKEYRVFTAKMKEVFEKVYEQLKIDYDKDKNKRLSKPELIAARREHREYYSYAIPVSSAIYNKMKEAKEKEHEKQKKAEADKKEPEKPQSPKVPNLKDLNLDEIYKK
ncbi:MAG: hypothetical protein NE330_14875 [Lentisphaeraceae bacterium]|nr:hypothetical protein [Lentisphaeraceae bacterium]